MDMIYEDAIVYVDRKISNTINMAMSPRYHYTIVAQT